MATDQDIAHNCSRCSMGHSNVCTCRKDCGHIRCSKKGS